MCYSYKFLRFVSFVSMLAFCFMFFGCDYVEQQENEISLKGKKITSQYSKELGMLSKINSGRSSLEFYSVNFNSPKAKEVKKRIKTYLKRLQNKNKNRVSSHDPMTIQEPDMKSSIIVENTETGKEALATPIDNGSETINQISYSTYDSETNTVNSEMLFYKAQTNFTKSELEANPELANQATLDLEIKDQNGILKYSNYSTMNNSKVGISVQPDKIDQTQGCMDDCVDYKLHTMNWYETLICMAFAIPCAISILITCGSYCWF